VTPRRPAAGKAESAPIERPEAAAGEAT